VTTIYSHSMLETMKACPCKYDLRYNHHLHRIQDQAGRSEHHPLFGAAGHEGLYVWYTTHDLNAAIAAFCAAYPTQLDPGDHAKTQVNGVLALQAYVERWQEEDAKYRLLEAERYTLMEGDEWSQHLDLVWQDRKLGGIYAVDHKFTKKSIIGSGAYDYWAKFSPNSQVTGYIDYVTERYGECSGFIVNAISLGYNQRKSKLHDAGPWADFARRTFDRQSKSLRRNRTERQWWVEQIEAAHVTQRWPQNTDSCGYCTFRAICEAEYQWPQDRETILDMYEQRCGECLANGRRCNRPWPHEGEECEWTPPAAVEEYEIVEEDEFVPESAQRAYIDAVAGADARTERLLLDSIELETAKRSDD
jgi:hypothetical protein